MDDNAFPELAALAATVDHGASRALFDRRRTRRRRRVHAAGLSLALLVAGVGITAWHLTADDGASTVVTVSPGPTSSTSSTTSANTLARAGQVVVDLVDPPMYIEGFDFAVRVHSKDGDLLSERNLEDFVWEAGEAKLGGSSSTTIDVPAGTVSLQGHLTIGAGPGPRKPDFINTLGDGLCSPVLVVVPPAGLVSARMDWATGCLESDDAHPPASSALLPGRAPDVAGLINGPFPGDVDRRPRLQVSTGSDGYYEGALLFLDGAALVDGLDGAVLSADDIVRGQRVDVWTAECDESLPVQCNVEAVRTRP